MVGQGTRVHLKIPQDKKNLQSGVQVVIKETKAFISYFDKSC